MICKGHTRLFLVWYKLPAGSRPEMQTKKKTYLLREDGQQAQKVPKLGSRNFSLDIITGSTPYLIWMHDIDSKNSKSKKLFSKISVSAMMSYWNKKKENSTKKNR